MAIRPVAVPCWVTWIAIESLPLTVESVCEAGVPGQCGGPVGHVSFMCCTIVKLLSQVARCDATVGAETLGLS